MYLFHIFRTFYPYIILYLFIHMIIGIIQIFFPFDFRKVVEQDNSHLPYLCILLNIIR